VLSVQLVAVAVHIGHKPKFINSRGRLLTLLY
jgi:hypothetical protein